MPAKVPGSLFGSQPKKEPEEKQQSSNAAIPQNSNTVSQQNGNTVKQEKATFYLDPEKHSEKLDQLCLEYKKRTGRRINRQDVVRRLIEKSNIEDLI